MDERLRSRLSDGERLRYDASLREGGVVGITDDRLVVVSDPSVSVPLENVREIKIEAFDWFLGVLSVVLVGFGVYSLRMHVLGGLAFAAAGLASLYRTYRRRGRVIVELHSDATPIDFFVEETDAFARSFEAEIERFDAERSNASG